MKLVLPSEVVSTTLQELTVVFLVIVSPLLARATTDDTDFLFDSGLEPMKQAGPESKSSRTIPWSEIGATAGAQYQGDGLSIRATGSGATLRCVFQKLEGEATAEGLWLTSTVPGGAKDCFRVVASSVGRTESANLNIETRGQGCPRSFRFQTPAPAESRITWFASFVPA